MCVVLCAFVCVSVRLCASVRVCVHEVKIYHKSGTFNCVCCVCVHEVKVYILQECTFNSHSSLAI